MAAVNLKDLLASQERMAEQEKSQGGERMTIAELKKLMSGQKDSLDEQVQVSNEIKSLSENSKTVQEKQLDLMTKTDRKRTKNEEESLKSSKETLREIIKQRKATESLEKAASAEKAKRTTDKAMGMETFKTIGDRIGNFKSSIKNLFTLRGFLDKSGIVKKGSGGILDTALARRDARKEYVSDRMKMEVAAGRMEDTAANRKNFAKQFERQQEYRI